MENYVIRRITTNDYHDIHELNLKLGYAYDEEKVAERIQNILDAGIDLILVAELEGKVVGYVHGTPYGTLYSDNLVSIIQMVFTNETRENKEMTSEIIKKVVKRNGYHGIRMAADIDRKVLYEIMMENGYENKRDLKHYIKYFQDGSKGSSFFWYLSKKSRFERDKQEKRNNVQT